MSQSQRSSVSLDFYLIDEEPSEETNAVPTSQIKAYR